MTLYNRNEGYFGTHVYCEGEPERCLECDNELELCGGHIGQLPDGALPDVTKITLSGFDFTLELWYNGDKERKENENI